MYVFVYRTRGDSTVRYADSIKYLVKLNTIILSKSNIKVTGLGLILCGEGSTKTFFYDTQLCTHVCA